MALPVRRLPAAAVTRLLLVVALAVGLMAMHALAAATGSGHGSSTTGEHATTASTSVQTRGDHPQLVGAPSGPGGVQHDGGAGSDGHGGAAACTLFAVTGLALLAALVLVVRGVRRGRRSASALHRRAVALVAGRGPPVAGRPRVALCVIRV